MPIPPIREAGDSEHIQDHNDISGELALRLPLSGGTLTGALSGTSADFSGNVIAADPTLDTHLTTKSYVDTELASAGSGIYAQATIRAVFNPGFSLAPLADGATGTIMTVTLPSGRFSQPPIVSCQEMNITSGGVTGDVFFDVLPYSVSTTSVGLWVQNIGPSISVAGGKNITAGVVDIWAVQMTSGSSLG